MASIYVAISYLYEHFNSAMNWVRIRNTDTDKNNINN